MTLKWELQATLRKMLRRSGIEASHVLGQRSRFTVTDDHA